MISDLMTPINYSTIRNSLSIFQMLSMKCGLYNQNHHDLHKQQLDIFIISKNIAIKI